MIIMDLFPREMHIYAHAEKEFPYFKKFLDTPKSIMNHVGSIDATVIIPGIEPNKM